jgi:hypothetical protein
MVSVKAMDHDNDIEHLFSWLQTPDLRYREFAGAREITDTIVTWQARANTTGTAVSVPEAPVRGNVQLREEYPADQFPDQTAVKVDIEPARDALHRAPEPPIAPPPTGGVDSSGRLLGGAYREEGGPGPGSGVPPSSSVGGQQPGEGSLDSVFSRLASGRGRLPDPRDRLRRGPGFSPADRPR